PGNQDPTKRPQDGQAQPGQQDSERQSLEGKLEAIREPQGEGKDGDKQQPVPKKQPLTPGQQEAERWLEAIEDKSKQIRESQIREAMGRLREPEKDW
ncbi:MAG: hypothetical protein ACREP8_04075, partial [Candidatus Binatia bacterium]